MSNAEPPSPYISSYPFQPVQGDLFPPVCLKTHWDPTAMLKHILPQQKVTLPQDFRPYVKVCKNYVTSAPAVPAPLPPSDMVFPTGGEFYPPGRYSAAIDNESKLRTLDQPLDKWCPTDKYIPPRNSDMFIAGKLLPERKPLTDPFVQELSMPQALLRSGPYICRSENDVKNFERSARLFNNPTKQDRYGSQKFSALPGGINPMPHGGVEVVPPTKSAQKGYYPVPYPGGKPDIVSGSNTSNSSNGSNVTTPLQTSCISVAGAPTCNSFAPA